MKKDEELMICKDAYQKFHRGVSMTDVEVSVLLKQYRSTVSFLQVLADPMFRLYLLKLADDLHRLDMYSRARKKDRSESLKQARKMAGWLKD